MIKILHIIPKPIYSDSGSGIRSKNILEHQKRFAQPVALVSPMFNPEDFPSENPIVINGIKYYHFLEKRFFVKKLYDLRITRALTTFLHRREFSKYIYEIAKKEKPNIIHSASPYTNGLPAFLVAKTMNIPFVYEIRGLSDYIIESPLKKNRNDIRIVYRKRLENNVLKAANSIITLSRASKEDICNRGIKKKKIFIVPNGINGGFLHYKKPNTTDLSKKYKISHSKIKLGFIGSLKAVEDVITLLDAIAILKKQFTNNIVLIIIGEGPMFSYFNNHAKNIGIKEMVRFIGRVPNSEIKKYYSMLDIFVIPRLKNKMTETISPLKILEAMGIGIPVIGSNVGGIAEIIKDGVNGFLFEPQNPEDLAKVLKKLINSKNLCKKVADRAKFWVQENRKWDNLIETYRRVYKNLLNESSTAK
ncbi:glycosyltransferase [candidate division WOR-3 bacterium]|nr:glycosyltransferase [candidate division WOR-3 bacterium]